MVEELIRGFLPGDWIERLDFSSLERVGNSFVSDDLRERHSDVIWRLRLKGEEGGWIYLYLLLEFQSTSDFFMAVRLLTYLGLLFEEIIRKEDLRPGDRLPAVLPVVLHNGESRWRAPLRLETLFVPLPEQLKKHLPRLTYLLLDESRLDLGRPELSRNPAAALFRFETNKTPEALPGLYQKLNDVLPRDEPALRRTVQAWVTAVVRRRVPDAIIPERVSFTEASMFEETLIKWRDQVLREADERRRQGLREGRREGRQEGQAQGMQKLILQQMTQRFGRLPARVRRQVEEISSIQELRKLGRRVLRAKSLAEMGLE
jgi:hypothetical protein